MSVRLSRIEVKKLWRRLKGRGLDNLGMVHLQDTGREVVCKAPERCYWL